MLLFQLRNITTLLSIFLLCSCGMSYEKLSHNLKKSVIDNKTYKVELSRPDSIDYLLTNQEAGLLYFLQNNPTLSLSYFNNANSAYQVIEQSSKLSARKALAFTFLSDTQIKYEGSDYEQGLVHYYSGLNYLLQNNLDAASVEFRAAEDNQKFSEELRLKKIIASEGKINAFLASNNLKSNDIEQALAQSRSIRANTQQKFLNANILYTAGIVRELNGNKNDALINYKQAYNLYPNNPSLLLDLYRLSLSFDNDFASTLAKQNPQLLSVNFTNYKNSKSVYLIYEQGFVPERKNLKIALIGVDNLAFSMNLPVYKDNFKPNNVNFSLNNNGTDVTSVNAAEDSNVYYLARNQLYEEYPIIIARQVTKLATQIIGQKALQNSKEGAPFSLVLGLTSLFDSSDTRSWRLLPNSTQIAKITTQNDFNNATIKINNNKSVTIPNLNIQNGQVAVVYVFDSGSTIYTKILYQGNK